MYLLYFFAVLHVFMLLCGYYFSINCILVFSLQRAISVEFLMTLASQNVGDKIIHFLPEYVYIRISAFLFFFFLFLFTKKKKNKQRQTAPPLMVSF